MSRKLGFVYELRDLEGGLFYIGSTTNPKKRHADYKALRAHGNRELLGKLSSGFSFDVVYSGEDYISEEYRRIQCGTDLANIMKEPNSFWRFKGKSSFGWYVRNYRNRFGSTDFLRELVSVFRAANESEKKEMEHRFSRVKLSHGNA